MLAPKVARIFPRKRRGENEDEGKKEIVLTAVEITNLFHLRQSEAANQLGISLTALKNACKQVGINNWPYPRSKKEEEETRETTADLFFMKADARRLPEDAPTLVRREVVAGVGAGVVAAPQLSLLPGISVDHLVPRVVEGGMGGEHAEVERVRNGAAGMERELRIAEGKEGLWYFGSGRRIHDLQVLSLLDDAFSCVVDHIEREETSPGDRADVM